MGYKASPSIYPAKRNTPFLSDLPRATQGSKPWDGGGLIVEPSEYQDVVSDPVAAQYLRPFRQTTELLTDRERWCLWLVGAPAYDLRQSRVIAERLEVVRDARTNCGNRLVERQAATPSVFSQIRQPVERYLAIPEVSSENRPYIPARYCSPDIIAGNKLITIEGAPLWLFGILQSAMFMAWVRTIVGRLETRYSLAPDLAYNAFPFPTLNKRSIQRIEEAAERVLEIRAAHSESTLEDLYGENSMPPELVHAHRTLDRAVDSAYAPRRTFVGDSDRINVLLKRNIELQEASELELKT